MAAAYDGAAAPAQPKRFGRGRISGARIKDVARKLSRGGSGGGVAKQDSVASDEDPNAVMRFDDGDSGGEGKKLYRLESVDTVI
mmetsp:Transcript_8487/g.24568  ORF Transcript_8487/g.24568 Transcript_8487/m.24568 type:complete len:84 (+) Transcript_8487:105-356(+)